MRPSWSVPIPQPMQQHGGHAKNPPKPAPKPAEDTLIEDGAPLQDTSETPQARQAAALKDQ